MPIIPQVTALVRRSVLLTAPLGGADFRLDTSGVAGVFGGEEAVSAMATMHVYEHRKLLGWYNSPGSYVIAKRYGRLARSKFFDGLFPGVHTDPATLFELDGWPGPKFRAAHSGTIIDKTSHMAALLMKECADLPSVEVQGRKTRPIGVTIAELHHIPPHEEYPAQISTLAPLYACLPILRLVLLLILLGIVVSGISCFVIGSGTFLFTRPEPAEGSPHGDGILSSDKGIVILIGEEAAVNSITRGRFSLQFDSEPHYENIGWCSVLLMIQFIAQLLLIPQGTLFGQMMFVTSLAVSWGYNLWLSAFDKERIQRNILMKNVLREPRLTKYVLGTRTSMVVFVLLILQPEEPNEIMNSLLPNDTKASDNYCVLSSKMHGTPMTASQSIIERQVTKTHELDDPDMSTTSLCVKIPLVPAYLSFQNSLHIMDRRSSLCNVPQPPIGTKNAISDSERVMHQRPLGTCNRSTANCERDEGSNWGGLIETFGVHVFVWSSKIYEKVQSGYVITATITMSALQTSDALLHNQLECGTLVKHSSVATLHSACPQRLPGHDAPRLHWIYSGLCFSTLAPVVKSTTAIILHTNWGTCTIDMGNHHSHEPEPDWAAIVRAQREHQEAEERQRQAEEAARHAREAAERATREAEQQRQREHEAQLAAERAAQAAREEAEQMRRRREEAEQAERRAREEAEARAREERACAERVAREMEEERRRQEAERLAAIAAREEEARRQRAVEEEARRARQAQEEAERQARKAAEAARRAQAEREEVERQLKKGVQPVVMPTAEEIRLAKAKVQYKDAVFHFAVAGIAGSGKSSLINALCGMNNNDPNAAPTGVNETTLEISRYVDTAHSQQIAWYDVPGSGTLTIPDWQYFNTQGLYVFDCILVLFNNRFTMTDRAILANCRRFQIPTFIVRSKSDQHILNLMKDIGYDPDEDTHRRGQFYKAAREQYTSETRQSVKNNLAEANLPDQRVYMVSNKALLGVVNDKGPKRMIDEVELLTDLYSEAYRSGKLA
ncbi:hypothetical protein EDC04DRAFT_2605316 [Pisolithus marmoratus]|nr:hypothetical protein EDC04DRAFT_2605316 [Pisolithus marmoratus]